MRILRLAALAVFLLTPGLAAAAAIPCSELPKAERYIRTELRPGPNTRLALKHIEAAKRAHAPRQCSAELTRADYYAKRSKAADARKRH